MTPHNAVDAALATLPSDARTHIEWGDMRRALNAAAPLMNQIVTTIEELDALPVGSIVLDDFNTDWRKTSEGIESNNWDSSSTSWTHTANDIILPAKVIHVGASA